MPEKTPRGETTILKEADEIITGPRAEAYGSATDNGKRTALIWEAILGFPVTPEQVMLCLLGLKIAREVHKPGRDNRVDMAGYAGVIDMVHVERERDLSSQLKV
jgi:hypothetical protein